MLPPYYVHCQKTAICVFSSSQFNEVLSHPLSHLLVMKITFCSCTRGSWIVAQVPLWFQHVRCFCTFTSPSYLSFRHTCWLSPLRLQFRHCCFSAPAFFTSSGCSWSLRCEIPGMKIICCLEALMFLGFLGYLWSGKFFKKLNQGFTV